MAINLKSVPVAVAVPVGVFPEVVLTGAVVEIDIVLSVPSEVEMVDKVVVDVVDIETEEV